MNFTLLSAFAGFAFGAVNFWLLSQIGQGMVVIASGEPSEEGHKPGSKLTKTIVFFVIKMTLLFVTIGLILRKGYVSSLPFLAGFTVSLVFGISFKLLRSKAEKGLE